MTRSRDGSERILRARAEALARPVTPVAVFTDELEINVLSFGDERYGIPTSHVLEVLALRDLTPVPCTPPFVLGILNYRGRILTVLDLRPLFELPGDGSTSGHRVVAVSAAGITFGIFAETASAPITLDAAELAPPPMTLPVDRQALIRGVTREMVSVLDLEALARDPRIQVNDEWGE
jgi:purine-binding chemotaxis protein CheW